jgi:hypothetical protein
MNAWSHTSTSDNRRQFLALTGLTLSEFQRLLTAFPQAYQQLYPANQTAEGQPRSVLLAQVARGDWSNPRISSCFCWSTSRPIRCKRHGRTLWPESPQVNYWIHRLLPVLRSALDDLGSSPSGTPRTLPRPKAPPGKRLDWSSTPPSGGARGRKTPKTGPFLQRAQEEALRQERGHRQHPGEADWLPRAERTPARRTTKR